MNTNRRTANKPKIEITARARVLNKRSILMVLYAIYIAFILVSIVPYIAEHQTRHKMDGEDFVYHIVFEEDGDDVAHYFEVVRADNSTPGILDLTYYPSTHVLDVDVINIQELVIDSESIYRDEADVIVGANYIDDPDYYKDWFIDKEIFTVNVKTDTIMTRIEFNDIPIPVSVLVDNEEWWKTNTNWKQLDDDDFEITKVPKGSTTVVIYFKDVGGQNPTALFSASKYIAVPNEVIDFDASGSIDVDGTIEHYIWDFGDTEEGSGVTIDHSYSETGNYSVILTVRDNDQLEDTYIRTIKIISSDLDSDNDGVVDVLDPNPYEMLDSDGDSLSDDFEDVISNTSKLEKDTDGDGWDDNIEWGRNTDPNDPTEHPKESEEEPDGVGTIAIIIIVVIIIIVIIIFVVMKKRKEAREAEVEPEETAPKIIKPPIITKTGKPGWRSLDDDEEQELEDLENEFNNKPKPPKFAPVEESEFECPTCGAAVKEEDTICPKCGEEFI